MGIDIATKRPYRLPVSIDGSTILADGESITFVVGNSTSLLRNYLTLVRAMRHQKRAPEIVLRRDDIMVLAEYLGEPPESVLDRLAALMGATRTQRTAMLSVFASGALLIGLASSTAASSQTASAPPSPTPATTAAPLVPEPVAAPPVTADAGADDATAEVVATTVVVEAPATTQPATDDTTTVPPLVASLPPTPDTGAPVVTQPAPVRTTNSGRTPTTTPVTVPTSTTIPVPNDAMGPAGATSAVGEPPVPADRPFVDVGEPPLETTPPDTAPPDTVPSPGGVGEPPLDLPTTTTVDPTTVEVGLPPVPTTTSTTPTTTPAP